MTKELEMMTAYAVPVIVSLIIAVCEMYFHATGKRKKNKRAVAPAVENADPVSTTGNANLIAESPTNDTKQEV